MSEARRILAAVVCCAACQTAADTPSLRPSADPKQARPNAQEALDRLDGRRPVPLLPMMAQHQKQNMREHLEAVQAVVAAVAVGDFEQVALASRQMGFSEAMGRTCEHMGAAAPGFTEQALGFHHTADQIAIAAGQRDSARVLSALSSTLKACTSCHATFKQQPVESLPD